MSDKPDSDGSPLEQDIFVTTQLLESFNAHSDTWEALEVSMSSQVMAAARLYV